MTEHDVLPDGDLAAWPEEDSYRDADYGDAYGDDTIWNDYPVRQAPLPPAVPWYRSPRLLLLLIGLAAAVLVVAAALLVTGRQSGEIPATPRLETRTTTSVAPTRGGSTAPMTPTSSSTPSSEAEESAESGVEQTPAEPVEPAPSAAPPPATPSRSGQGPKINVTRTPMSFTPGKPG